MSFVEQIFSRYLDTVGDGSGTKSAIGDYSSTAQIFRIKPAAGTLIHIQRLLVTIEDTAPFAASDYGNISLGLTNGVIVRSYDDDADAVITDFTDGIPITNNAEWGSSCFDVDLKTWSSGNEFLLVRMSFNRFGDGVVLKDYQALEVVLNDDLQPLISQRFVVQGHQESVNSRTDF